MAIDYSGFAFPKTGHTPKTLRAKRRRTSLAAAAVDRDARVINRHGGRCVGLGVNPTCQGKATEPHELIPVGAGGPRESWNRVPVCRACHNEAQGRVGGNRLKFSWPGIRAGGLPNADKPGNVRVWWAGKK